MWGRKRGIQGEVFTYAISNAPCVTTTLIVRFCLLNGTQEFHIFTVKTDWRVIPPPNETS